MEEGYSHTSQDTQWTKARTNDVTAEYYSTVQAV